MPERTDIPRDVMALLVDIQDWMMRNDYECGEEGSALYQEISELIGEDEDDE
jgi:hypothetical protein